MKGQVYKKDKKICICSCHVKGSQVMHMRSCCINTYQHYIEKGGEIDMETFNKINK